MIIQKITQEQIAEAVSIKPDDWGDYSAIFHFYLAHPEVCHLYGIFEDDRIISTGNYSLHKGVAWLGHIIVAKEHRNKGLGATMAGFLIDKVKKKQCKTILLIATELGEPVYQKLGFKSELKYEVLKGEIYEGKVSENIREMKREDLTSILALDKQVTGEDRSYLIQSFCNKGWVFENASGEIEGFYLPELWDGPVVALNQEAGCELLRKRCSEKNIAILPTGNTQAIRFLNDQGFQPVDFHASRMYLGENVNWLPENIFNRIGGAFG